MSTWSTHGPIAWRHSPFAKDTLEYLPREPAPVRTENGRPSVLFMQGADGYHLQLGAQWDPESGALEALRAEREHATGRRQSLAPPMGLQVYEAILVLVRRNRGAEVLQRTATSGYAPWSASFAVSLTPERGIRVAEALRGAQGRLAVRFRAACDGAELEREADVASWFGPGHEVEALVVAAGVRALSRADDHQGE
jgi:hypothetical protein